MTVNDGNVELSLRIYLAKDALYGALRCQSVLIGRNKDDETVLLSAFGRLSVAVEHGCKGKDSHIQYRHGNENKEYEVGIKDDIPVLHNDYSFKK